MSEPTARRRAAAHTPIEDPREVERVAERIAAAGIFALDLEFVSESRYLPNLCLLQLAWGDPEAPEVALVDPLAADPRPIVALVADAAVDVVLHSAQGDLALLAQRFGVEGRAVWDSQVAAGFLGLGDQVGYAGLVEQLTGTVLDKGAQFTNWCRRPLSAEQLRYAVDDVWFLPGMWREMARRLAERGRLAWVAEESARVARAAATRPPPEEMYRRVKGWERLPPEAREAVRALAAWRERRALETNKPPQWLLRDAALLEVARRRPHSAAELRQVRGVHEETARRLGREILAVLAAGAEAPEMPPRRDRLPEHAAGWGAHVAALVQARSRDAEVAPRFVAARAEAEALVRWWVERGSEGPADTDEEPELPLLSGWRREIAGQAALDWLAGRRAAAGDCATEPAAEPEAEPGAGRGAAAPPRRRGEGR